MTIELLGNICHTCLATRYYSASFNWEGLGHSYCLSPPSWKESSASLPLAYVQANKGISFKIFTLLKIHTGMCMPWS